MEKNNYRFYEIVYGLRDYLLEEYRILSEMLSLIDIESEDPCEVEIKISQKTVSNFFNNHIVYSDKPYNGELLLFISKTRFSPFRIIRKYKTRYVEYDTPLYSIDNADYSIEKKDEEFIFKRKDKNTIKRSYEPILRIINKEKFAELYHLLETKGYLSYPGILFFHHGTPDFSLNIDSQNIGMEESENYNAGLRIEYDPLTDSLYANDTRKNALLSPGQMFSLRIPKKEIYKGYASIIDSKISNMELSPPIFEKRHKKTFIFSFSESTKMYTRIKKK